jgi:hypothetical protein
MLASPVDLMQTTTYMFCCTVSTVISAKTGTLAHTIYHTYIYTALDATDNLFQSGDDRGRMVRGFWEAYTATIGMNDIHARGKSEDHRTAPHPTPSNTTCTTWDPT